MITFSRAVTATTLVVFLAILFFAFTKTSNAEGAYVSAYGGVNWDSVYSASFINENSGSVVGVTIGKDVSAVKGLRVELDLSNRTNDVDLFGGKITASHETTALMANAVYDVPVDWAVKPYVLAGVGYAMSSATFEDIHILSLESSGVAWQLGAGANYEVSKGVTLGVGYRYLEAPEINVFGLDLADGSNHSLIAQVTFNLN